MVTLHGWFLYVSFEDLPEYICSHIDHRYTVFIHVRVVYVYLDHLLSLVYNCIDYRNIVHLCALSLHESISLLPFRIHYHTDDINLFLLFKAFCRTSVTILIFDGSLENKLV